MLDQADDDMVALDAHMSSLESEYSLSDITIDEGSLTVENPVFRPSFNSFQVSKR